MIYLYPYENIIQYKEKEETSEIELSTNALINGKINNIPIFEAELKHALKKKKWITLFQEKAITLVLPLEYNEKEKEVFLVILENIGLKKIKCIKAKINLKKNKIVLEVHNNYLYKHYLNKKRIITEKYPYYIFKSAKKTIKYILDNQTKKNRFYFLGSNPKIPDLITYFNQPNLYYYTDYKEHIIKHSSS